MSSRTSRVEQLVRREIAEMLLRGELRDPVLADPSAISITGASVSPDLSVARVFVDVLGGRNAAEVLRVLNAAAGKFRSHIGRVARLRRAPSLRFESDPSIAHGAAIERVLAELAAEQPRPEPPPAAAEPEPSSTEEE